jgi:DNA-binding MarR family transcriptional regulator
LETRVTEHPFFSTAPPPEVDRVMRDLFGVESLEIFNLFRRLKFVSHLLGYLNGEYRKDGELSGARMRLLINLTLAKRLGNPEGVLPSELSDHLGVSRNTVSALLNGLEEQGLVERHLHPTDRRQLLIRVTPAGEATVQDRAPAFAQLLERIFGGLAPDDRATLITLLDQIAEALRREAEALGLSHPCPAQETD